MKCRAATDRLWQKRECRRFVGRDTPDVIYWRQEQLSSSKLMRTVILPLKPSELPTQMAAMRVWLDERRVEPASFSCRDSGAGVVVRVDFRIADQADAFARHFTGQSDRALPQAEGAPDRARFLPG